MVGETFVILDYRYWIFGYAETGKKKAGNRKNSEPKVTQTRRAMVGKTKFSKTNPKPPPVCIASKELGVDFARRSTPRNPVSREVILAQTKNAPDSPVERKNFHGIFRAVDWNTKIGLEEETKAAEKNIGLKKKLWRKSKEFGLQNPGKVQIDILCRRTRHWTAGIKTRKPVKHQNMRGMQKFIIATNDFLYI